MADDEYLYKLGIDATDFNAAVAAMRTILGEMQTAIGGNQRAFAAADAQMVKFQARLGGMAGDVGKTADAIAKSSASTREQVAGFEKYVTALEKASGAYKTFREAQVVGTDGGTDVWAMSEKKIRQYIATYEAMNASVITAGKERLRIEASVTTGVEQQVQARWQAGQREIENADAIAVAEEISAKRRIQANADALSAEVAAQRSATVRATTILANGTSYVGPPTSAQQRSVGNAATVQPAGGGPSEAQATSSAAVLAQMRAYYVGADKAAIQTRDLTTAQQRLIETQARAAASAKLVNNQFAVSSTSLPRLRYALYDISTTFGVLGAGLAGVGAGITKVSLDYQTSFASVARTSKDLTDGQLANLKSSLIDLSTRVPASFDDISKVATLGNQLNIPAQQLASFTQTVIQFASASGMTVDAAATAFGRLGEILHTTNYQAIGDQIAYLGVRAVATEADITKVASQIAVTTTSYGLSQQATLALATAYASLGIKAESARGSTVRMFADIQKAVQNGGKGLAELGSVSGLGAAGFQKLWDSDANKGMTVFLQGLKAYGSDTRNVLADLGITAQRDITNIGLLAGSNHILTDAQQNATKSGGALDAMFKKQTDTISGQLAIASNRWGAFLNSLAGSGAGPLKGIVAGLNELLSFVDKLAKDPIAAAGLGLSAGLVTLAGTFLLVTAGAAQYGASILALRTFTEALGGDSTSLGGIFRAITGATDSAAVATERYAATLAALETTESATRAEEAARAATLDRLDVAVEKAAVAQAEWNLAASQGLGIGEAVVVETAALELAQSRLALAEAQAAAAAADDVLQQAKLVGSLEAITTAAAAAALAQNRLAGAESGAAAAAANFSRVTEEGAAARLSSSMDGAARSGSSLTRVLGTLGLVGAVAAVAASMPAMLTALRQAGTDMAGLTPDVNALTGSILGLNDAAAHVQNLAAIKNALPNGKDTTNNVWANIGSAFLAPLGATFQADNGKTYNSTQGAVNKMLTGQTTPGTNIGYAAGGALFNSQVGTDQGRIGNADQAIAAAINKGDYKGAAETLALYAKNMKEAHVQTKDAYSVLTATTSALGAQTGANLQAALAAKKSADGAKGTAKAFSTLEDAAFGAGPGLTQVEQDMAALGTSFEKDGASVAINGGALRKVIDSIYAQTGGGIKAADQMQGLFDALVKGGMASAAQLAPLTSLIKQLANGAQVTAEATPGIVAMIEAYNKAADAANKSSESAVKAQRTLLDYGRDLSTTFSNMDTYQWGTQDASDKVSSTWTDIKTKAADAAASIKSIRTDLLALNASKAQQSYDVKIAQAYGDTIGEVKAKAALAKTNNDIASKQKDLTKAQDDSSTSLKGNSAAAIQNRATLEGQVKNYQDYITALATSGASQKDIQKAIAASRAEFVKHATQLGYNKSDVDKLASSFTGMSKIVQAIPRNITTKVNANTSAAMKAIADYKASIVDAQKTAAKVQHIPVPKVSPADGPKKVGEQIGVDITSGIKNQLAKNLHQMMQQDQANAPAPAPTGYQYAGQGSGGSGSNNQVQTGGTGTGFWADIWNLLTLGGGSNPKLGFADGGWTGNGGTKDWAGMVHGQEFVLNALGAQMLPMSELNAMNQGRAPQSAASTIVIGGGGSKGGLTAGDRMFLAQVLSARPPIQLSASQFGKAIDHANVVSGMRGQG